MKPKPLAVLPAATRDVRSAAIYYRREAGETIAIRFIEALQRRYRAIAARPGIGSVRFASALDLEGLRTVPVKRFPYLIFYVELENQIEIWRVLHTSRDVPAAFQAQS